MKSLQAFYLAVQCCTNALTASLPVSSSGTLPTLNLASDANSNVTLPSFNLTLPGSYQLPQEPFYYNPTKTDKTLKIYGFGYPITQADLIEIYHKVRRDVSTYLEDAIISVGALLYASGDVRLVLHQKGQMTWGMWEAVVLGILAFGTEYEDIELDFDIYSRGLGTYFGTGVLTQLRRAETS